jgi:hypothetical protein
VSEQSQRQQENSVGGDENKPVSYPLAHGQQRRKFVVRQPDSMKNCSDSLKIHRKNEGHKRDIKIDFFIETRLQPIHEGHLPLSVIYLLERKLCSWITIKSRKWK